MEPQHLDDRELFSRVVQGASDPATWSAFVTRFSKLCYHAIYRVMARHAWMTPADADELFQRLFEHLLADDRRVLRRYRGENGCSPGTYLAHIAAYRATEYVRKRERQMARHVSVDDEKEHVQRLPDGGLTPEDQLERQVLASRVRRALETLSASDQLLYQLHYVRGMSLADISGVMAKSEAALHIQHHRLKDRVRRAMAAEQDQLMR